MRTKTITFEHYTFAKKGNEDKSYNEIFEIAWKRTDEYKVKIAKRKKAIKVLSIAGCGLIFTWFSVMLSPSLIAHADTLAMENLIAESPDLLEKLRTIKKLYTEYITACNMTENHPVFLDMICKMLDKTDFDVYIKAAEGLEVEEMINLISCL